MISALEQLKKEKPELYRTFTQALIDDLGLISGQSVSIFTCPSCNSSFQVVLSERKARPRSGRSTKPVRSVKPAAEKRSPMKSPLFAALVGLARLRKTRVGEINAEFRDTMKNKIKNMDKKDARAAKIEWLKKEITKAKSRAA